MPSNLNKLLEECREKTTALVEEIEKYSGARELNSKATESLVKMSDSLQITIKNLTPYDDLKMKRFQLIVFAALGINVVLLVMIIALIIVSNF